MSIRKPLVITGSPYLRKLQYIVYGAVILYFGKTVFIPLSFALLISFVLYPVCAWLERKGTSRLTAIVISMGFLILLGLLLLALLVQQFISFAEEWPSLQVKLTQSLKELSDVLVNVFNISIDEQRALISKVSDESGGNLFKMIGNFISASALSAVLFVLIPVYAVLILYYRNYWMKILFRLFPSESNSSILEIISLTIQAYYNFIKGMALVYVIVGTLNSIGLLALGVPHAILFGFIASILTFIPYIGIIAGSLLPVTMAWITYDSMWYPVGVIAIFAFVQYLEANIIFPVAVSNRLHVNTLVMLIAIFTGGVIWGMAGMILFVPLVGIAKLVADHNPRWRTISMILGPDKERMS